MNTQSIFFVQSSHKTKTWWMFLSVLLLVFVPFLIVWLLSGEFNLMNTDWLVAKGASVWHGIVPTETQQIHEMAERYAKFYDGGQNALETALSAVTGQSMSIDSAFTFFNPIILAPLLGLLVWSFAYPIIGNALKLSGLDVMPFSLGVGTFMLVTIFSGLIPQWGQNMMAIYWIVRILIAFVDTFIIFLIANYFTNRYIASKPYATDIYFGYKSIDKDNALAKEQLKENLDIFKQHKDADESFVEVKEGE